MKKVTAFLKSPHFLSAVILTALFVPLFAGAFNVNTVNGIATDTNAEGLAMKVIQWILVVVGIVAVLFLIVGGVQYIISHGNEDLKEKAKKTITYAIVGVIVVLVAYVIVATINNVLMGK